MSGTMSTTLHRWSARPAVRALRPRLRRSLDGVRAQGGLRVGLAVPAAVLLTGSVLWITVTVAGAWAA